MLTVKLGREFVQQNRGQVAQKHFIRPILEKIFTQIILKFPIYNYLGTWEFLSGLVREACAYPVCCAQKGRSDIQHAALVSSHIFGCEPFTVSKIFFSVWLFVVNCRI